MLQSFRSKFPAKAFGNFLWQCRACFPCTLRGAWAIVLATLAVRTLAIAEFDLVANILGWSVLGIWGLAFISVVFLRIRLPGKIRADVHFSAPPVLSRRPVPAGIRLNQFNLPPFFALEVSRVFKQAGILAPKHLISGSADVSRILVDALVFPHRGFWEMQALEFRLSDNLGFCALSWRMPLPFQIHVSAQHVSIAPLPIVASSHRAGEELSTSSERTGDLFDIKTYDPSDGIKRILWKTYARSGELVSRRPEPATIPDGELGIFLVARTEDDHLAGCLQDYLQQLRAHDIEVLFGSDTLSGTQRVVSKEEDIQNAIDGDVWSPDAGTCRGLGDFLKTLSQQGRSTDQVVIVADIHNLDWLKTATHELGSQNTHVLVALATETSTPRELRTEAAAQVGRQGFQPHLMEEQGRLG